MSKTLRNFWLDIALFTLLGVNIATLTDVRTGVSAADLSVGSHIHVYSGIILTLGCLIHIGLHWQWFQVVLTGKAKGRIKLFMNSMVTLAMLLAGVSGPLAHASSQASRFHSAVGSIALLGLFIHAVKHLRWMASVTKKLVPGRKGSISPSA
jgi:hypothetical protein